jgi:hypothetical protein
MTYEYDSKLPRHGAGWAAIQFRDMLSILLRSYRYFSMTTTTTVVVVADEGLRGIIIICHQHHTAQQQQKQQHS